MFGLFFKYASGVLAARRALRRSFHLRASAIRRRLFILEEDWTPTKMKLSQLITYKGGSLIFFQDNFSTLTAQTLYSGVLEIPSNASFVSQFAPPSM